MKKTLALILALMFVLSLCIIPSISAEVPVLEGEWYPWVMDGNEITYGSVTTDDSLIIKDFSSNWQIIAQNNQEKITTTYMSPATVWTTDTSKDLVLCFKVKPGSYVQLGFLHNIGSGNVNAGYPVINTDASGAEDKMTLEYSVDGTTWQVCSDLQILGEVNGAKQKTLTSGMTGYTAPITTAVGDGTAQYSEDYFIIQGTVGQTANYVRYVYYADSREPWWDPVVRDAVVTAPVDGGDESAPGTPETGDNSVLFVIALCAAFVCTAVVIIKKKRA
ncbi:MAG TPA: hypothetical protein PLT66_05395 [Bacillota bacterium]|nr:hypothetical protein [Bacillota bacterium]